MKARKAHTAMQKSNIQTAKELDIVRKAFIKRAQAKKSQQDSSASASPQGRHAIAAG